LPSIREPLKQPTKEEYDATFEPYAKEIGFLLRDWNNLQETLRGLFILTIGAELQHICTAVWHAVPVDRFQRNMLRGAAKVRFHKNPKPGPGFHETRARNLLLLEEIDWICEKADSLGRQRDDAAHVPVSLLVNSEPFEFISHALTGHPIAVQLAEKDLLAEFKLYRDRAVALRTYARQIERLLMSETPLPLPERFLWPERPRSSERKAEPGQGHARGQKRRLPT
jgi:hypothetical protein